MPSELAAEIMRREKLSPELFGALVDKIAASIDGKEFSLGLSGEIVNKIKLSN